MIGLTIHATADGYMLGATDEPIASTNWRFWHPAGETDCNPCTIETWVIPDEMADAFLAHGTSDQEFDDGYTAMDAMRRHGTFIATLHASSER